MRRHREIGSSPRSISPVAQRALSFSHLAAGFDNGQLTSRVGALLDEPYTGRQATYDLRRLKRKRLIERLPHTRRYQLTERGRRIAVLFTKAHGRVLTPGLAWLHPHRLEDIAARSPLAQAWRRFDRALDDFIDSSWWPPENLICP